MSADAITECPRCGQQQLREWHEMGVDGGVFIVEFTARCRECGYAFKFSHEEDVS